MIEYGAISVCHIIDRKSPIYRYHMVTHKGYKSNN